jgi:hypothetical protein
VVWRKIIKTAYKVLLFSKSFKNKKEVRMFNETLIKRFMQIANINDKERAERTIANQAKYLKINKHLLLKSYTVLEREKKEQDKEKAFSLKAQTKNILIQKYKDEIVELYCKKGFGYLKISNAMKINHNVKISKSAIENFIKINELEKMQVQNG